jgi:hypothetical protein
VDEKRHKGDKIVRETRAEFRVRPTRAGEDGIEQGPREPGDELCARCERGDWKRKLKQAYYRESLHSVLVDEATSEELWDVR